MVRCFADTAFWIALSRKRDQYHQRAVAWNQSVFRTQAAILTAEAVLWEWLNALSDPSTRRVAADGYRRVRADVRITAPPCETRLIDAAVVLYDMRR